MLQHELPLFDHPSNDRLNSVSIDSLAINKPQVIRPQADNSHSCLTIPPDEPTELVDLNQQDTASVNTVFESLINNDIMVSDFTDNLGISDNIDKPGEIVSIKKIIVQLFANLSDREQSVITLRYGLHDGELRTLEKVGRFLGFSRARASQLEQKALRRLHRPDCHRIIQPIILMLEKALERSQGVISVASTQAIVGASDDYEPHTFEAVIGFLLTLNYTIEKVKGASVITFKHEPYNTFMPHIAGICAIFRRIFARSHQPLSVDEMLLQFVIDDQGKSIKAQIPEYFLVACLKACPDITVDEQERYQLQQQAILDANRSDPRLPDTALPVAVPIPVVIEHAQKPVTRDQTTTVETAAEAIVRAPDAYDAWNHALIAYFTGSVQRGTTVFLSVDDEIIAQIGRHLRATNTSDLEDFYQAVRNRVIHAARVNLNTIYERNEAGEPQGVAFLAAMVLAASRMADEEAISHLDYFNRLREVLDLPLEDGRPRGMQAGAEESLWREWTLWLQEQGFLPSASRGKEGAQKYIAYPISQALLRGVDKDRLRRLFADKHWSEDWDAETLIARVRREAGTLSKHLQSVLNSHERSQALAEAIHEVYEAWQDDPQSGRGASDAARSPHLFAWLYRTEDIFSGTVAYYLYPRSSRRQHAAQVQIRFDGTLHTVGIDCPGWYTPIGPISAAELDNGGHYTIEEPADLDVLILRQRQFWILKPDPENPNSGVYASWGRIDLGTPFILLCQQQLIPQLEQLQAELLIKWDGEQRPFADGNWVELQHCMIQSQEWSGISIENKELYDALQPSISVSISMAGGLCVPKVGGWLEGHGPRITIFGFQAQADVCVIRVADENVVIEQPHDTSVPFDIEWPGPGDYRIEAVCAGDRAERLVKIIPWEHLHLAAPEHRESVSIGDWRVCGATVELVAN